MRIRLKAIPQAHCETKDAKVCLTVFSDKITKKPSIWKKN